MPRGGVCSQILVVMAMLVRVLHWVPAACGLASTVALIPLTIFTGRRLASIRKGLMLRTDARIKLCSEVVTGTHPARAFEEAECGALCALPKSWHIFWWPSVGRLCWVSTRRVLFDPIIVCVQDLRILHE